MEHEHYERRVIRPRPSTRLIDSMSHLIDAVINDQEVYGVIPFEDEPEPLTELDQRAYGTIVE